MDSDKKSLPTTTSAGKGVVQLHDNGLKAGTLIDNALSRLNSDQVQNLVAKAGDEALRLEVKHREQNMDYIAGKRDIDNHIDAFKILDKNGKFTRNIVETDVKTGAGNMKITSKSGATCFVASMAYGDINHPDVILLRSYRDNVLNKHAIGRSFIAWYWRNGPKLADAIGWSHTLRSTARFFIKGLIFFLRKY